MKNLRNYILCFFLIITNLSCRSQIKNSIGSKQKNLITAIKDAVVCKEGRDVFKITYSLPKLNLDNKNTQKTLNTLIYQQTQDNTELFELLENDSLKTTTEDAVKLMFEKIRANCSPSYYGFGEINVYFNTLYNKKEFVSIECYRESFFANYQQSIYPVNINLKTIKLLTIDDIINLDKKKFLIKKNDSIIQKIITDDLRYYKEKHSESYLDAVNNIKMYYNGFSLNDLNFFILTSKNNIDGLLFIYSLGYAQPFKSLEPSFDLFYSFDELKPYLTKEFKEQLDIH